MDGDAGPYMPVDLEVLPRVLKVFAPTKHQKKKTASLSDRTPFAGKPVKGVRIMLNRLSYMCLQQNCFM